MYTTSTFNASIQNCISIVCVYIYTSSSKSMLYEIAIVQVISSFHIHVYVYLSISVPLSVSLFVAQFWWNLNHEPVTLWTKSKHTIFNFKNRNTPKITSNTEQKKRTTKSKIQIKLFSKYYPYNIYTYDTICSK